MLADDKWDGEFMIQCENCHVWQHGACVGIKDQASCPDKYYCELCKPRTIHGYKRSEGTRVPLNRQDTHDSDARCVMRCSKRSSCFFGRCCAQSCNHHAFVLPLLSIACSDTLAALLLSRSAVVAELTEEDAAIAQAALALTVRSVVLCYSFRSAAAHSL